MSTPAKFLWFVCGTDTAHRISAVDAERIGFLKTPRPPASLTAAQAKRKRWRVDYLTGALVP